MIYYCLVCLPFLSSYSPFLAFLPFISEQAIDGSTLLININNEQKDDAGGQSPHGLCLTSDGPRDQTGGIVKSGADPDFKPDVQGTPLTMQIAVEFYLDADVRKADYFQKKLNSLLVKSLSASSVEAQQPPK